MHQLDKQKLSLEHIQCHYLYKYFTILSLHSAFLFLAALYKNFFSYFDQEVLNVNMAA